MDVITPNQTEAQYLTGVRVSGVSTARIAAQALLERGVEAAVELGEMGVYYASDRATGHVPAYEVEVVDTVAAGDGFGGALAVALAEGHDLEAAVSYGAAAGALTVTRPGAQEAMPARDEVETLLSQK